MVEHSVKLRETANWSFSEGFSLWMTTFTSHYYLIYCNNETVISVVFSPLMYTSKCNIKVHTTLAVRVFVCVCASLFLIGTFSGIDIDLIETSSLHRDQSLVLMCLSFLNSWLRLGVKCELRYEMLNLHRFWNILSCIFWHWCICCVSNVSRLVPVFHKSGYVCQGYWHRQF